MTTTTHAYHPETIANLEATIAAKIQTGQTIAAQLIAAHRHRLAGRQPNPPVWYLRRRLESIQDELDLDYAELERRRI